MRLEDALVLTLSVLAAATALLGVALPRVGRWAAAGTLVLLLVDLVYVWIHHHPHDEPLPGHHVTTLAAGVAAVAGGGLITTQVFGLVDGGGRVQNAGAVLRGGAWIGALERIAVFVALLAGWAPGLAIVLAVKGLGRYPELRNQEDTGAAERFIIGTFTSVLWAAACAGLAVLSG